MMQWTSFRFALFASSDYVRHHLPARRLVKGEASAHPFVGLDERWKELPHEQWIRKLGATRFAFRSSSMEAIVEAVHQGVGLAAFLEKDPRNTDLIRVETDIVEPHSAVLSGVSPLSAYSATCPRGCDGDRDIQAG